MHRFGGWWVGALMLALSAPALAQDTDPPQCERVMVNGRPEIVCREITIEGSSPRPYLLLGRSRDRHDPPPLRRQLAPEIPRTVRRTPF